MAPDQPTGDLPENETVLTARDEQGDSGEHGEPQANEDGVAPGSLAPGAHADSPELENGEAQEVPAFVITCPTCNTSIPFVPGVEGFEPSMGQQFLQCPSCDGFGEVKTGSLVPAHAVLTCPDCEGKGFKLKDGVTLADVAPHGEPPWEGAKWNDALGTWT